MRRATAFAIALTLSGGLAALAVDDRPASAYRGTLRHETPAVRVEAPAVRIERPHTVAASATVLPVSEPEPTTTTVPETTTTPAPEPEPEPEPTTTTTEPLLCPGLPHPAHHRPCPPTATTAPARPPVVSARGSATSDLLDALADCESDITASMDNGNGYYGAFQWLPRTWWGLTRPGQPWDSSYEAEMIAEILATSYSGQKAVAALIPLSSWPSQFPSCSRELGVG